MGTADNQRIERAVVVNGGRIDSNQAMTRLALFDENGDSISFPIEFPDPPETPVAGDVLLTDYVSQEGGTVADTDNLLEAIAKLEARIIALETA